MSEAKSRRVNQWAALGIPAIQNFSVLWVVCGSLTHQPDTALFLHAKPPYPLGAPGSPNLQGYAARAVVHTKCDSASGGSHACRIHSARDASFSPPATAGFFSQRMLSLCTNRRLCGSLTQRRRRKLLGTPRLTPLCDVQPRDNRRDKTALPPFAGSPEPPMLPWSNRVTPSQVRGPKRSCSFSGVHPQATASSAVEASTAVSLGRFRRPDTRSPVQRMDTSQGRWGLKPRKH